MNRILIKNLKLPAKIGAHPWEQTIAQHLIFELKLDYDFSAAAASDELKKAVDYIEICEVIKNFLQAHVVKLLETLAEKLITELFKKFPSLEKINLKIYKPAASDLGALIGVQVKKSK